MKIGITLFALIALAGLCYADTIIVQKVESGAMLGQPAKNGIQTMKIKGSKARIDHDTAKQYQIVDLATKKVYLVDPDKKQVMVMGLDMMNAAGAMMKQLNQNGKLEVKDTGSVRTVNGFKCKDYLVSMSGGMGINSKQCVTTDVDYSDFEAFRPYAEGFMKMFVGDKNAPQLPPGISVLTETEMNIMGQKMNSKTELQSLKKEEIPATDFEPPAGFEVKEVTGMPKQ